MPTISYAITVYNEYRELKRLVTQLLTSIRQDDEIVIQQDSSGEKSDATRKVEEYVNSILSTDKRVHFINHPLNKDFATFKNNIKGYCKNDYICFIDADETLSPLLLDSMHDIISDNPETELYFLPRVNTVSGITQEHIDKWGWRLDQLGRVNWPDYQGRVVKNLEGIKWEGKVHEKIIGARLLTPFPCETSDFALLHPKTIEKQEKQNSFYGEL
jgi:glycosyltransferase involved in cell wall biosynthesis